MDRIKSYVQNNPRVKRVYVCKHCADVFFVGVREMDAHMNMVHGNGQGTVMVSECRRVRL